MVTNSLVMVALLTLLPGLELRLSILYGLSQGINPVHVFLVAVLANALLGPLVLLALHTVLPLVLRIKAAKKLYAFFVLRTREKYRPIIEKYGPVGLVLFIALPVPGSGSWTGALAAFLLGIGQKKFALLNFGGVVIAGVLVTLAGLGMLAIVP